MKLKLKKLNPSFFIKKETTCKCGETLLNKHLDVTIYDRDKLKPFICLIEKDKTYLTDGSMIQHNVFIGDEWID